ncbi:HRDC domain-containing protein [Fulvimonas sp. R45]|uniref:ribonuclease D n=1 Tax=Fulvimonas sp. R45 TaxID=3045937 RepID=UPI00265EC6F8|nr:HRDC domain-containing protein [Fulvimonas sp. R45]MDO1527456.1 HRDC domain-containing protein [Fulvimonas sp. R45]
MLSPAPTAEWIDQRSALERWLAELPPDASPGLDTEFMRRNTFHPQLALLQLGWNGRHALVDPLAFDLGDALRARLAAPGTTVVMHSAGEDLETLAPWLPDGPGTLFDTQLAAAFAGLGLGVSYRALVAELAGAELDKGETRSDWMQRPLTESQRSYATLDVVYLDTLHAQLAERLRQRGYADWHAEDCARLKQRASHREGEPQPQRGFRSAAEWPRAQQALLRRILLWRDRSARTLDRPRPWLLEDALALALAQQPPASLAELDQRGRGQRALRAPQRAELFDLLRVPADDAEQAATAPIPALPFGETKKAFAAMKQEVDRRAAELDLPPGLLCPRKALEEYAVTAEWPELLDGWRREVLHDALSALLPA